MLANDHVDTVEFIGEVEEFEEEYYMQMEEDDTDYDELGDRPKPSKHILKRNAELVGGFLGRGKLTHIPVIKSRYYDDLLAWALKHYIETNHWNVVQASGHYQSSPDYTSVNTDYDTYEECMDDGFLLLEKDDKRIVASVKIGYRYPSKSVLVKSNSKKVAREFSEGLKELAQPTKLYGGKKISVSNGIRFITVPDKGWQDLALEPEMKDELGVNTIEFLNKKAVLDKYHVPTRRGIILAGEPGTGKTLICKIIMNCSPGITCITAESSLLVHPAYIHDLYTIANDLKPCIVFIEDIDLIGESRRHFKNSALPALLARLDGIEACQDIITIATTNFLEEIDSALRKRPSRFDRIFQIGLPDEVERRNLLRILSEHIPMGEEVQDYLAARTAGCTPAVIQEIVYSLVIEHKHNPSCTENGDCCFDLRDAEKALNMVKFDRKVSALGFLKNGSRNVEEMQQSHILNKTK